MHEPRAIVIILCVAALACGCSTLDGQARRPADASWQADQAEAELLSGHLAVVEQLLSAVPGGREEIVAQVHGEAILRPTPSNRLRDALAMSVPSTPGSDAAGAEQILGELLASGDGLQPAELALARFVHQSLADRLTLEAQNRQLAGQASQESQARVQTLNRRLQSLNDENLRLRQQLNEALEKLAAVAALEKSLSTREATSKRPP